MVNRYIVLKATLNFTRLLSISNCTFSSVVDGITYWFISGNKEINNLNMKSNQFVLAEIYIYIL